MMKNLFNKNILKQQQETTAQINALMAVSAKALACGPDCQKMKKTQELEQIYINAQTNMATAPSQLESARKNYYTITKGEPAYDAMLEEDLKKKADIIGKEISKNFLEEVKKTITLNIFYNTDLINSKNTTELYEDYTTENKQFETIIKNKRGDILTQDRKTYYETQEYDSLGWWYNFLLSIYYILVFAFFLASILTPSKLKTIEKLGLLLCFIFYPYIMNYIFTFIIGIINKINSLLPKNVYTELAN